MKGVSPLLSNLLRNIAGAISDAIQSFVNVLQSITLIDVVDIVLLTYIVYLALKLIRETRAGQLLKGIVLLVAVFFLSKWFELKALNFIIVKVLNAGLMAIIVLFQPELRRVLERFGQTTMSISRLTIGQNEDVTQSWERAIPVICVSTVQLASTCTGALIVIERSSKLGEQIMNGTVMKAEPTVELFGNIFYPKTPLHDGAVIMRDGIIWAAACFLPKPQKDELIDKRLGSRHRAAIGMSENSDALVIVVSEETGQISVAQNGVLTRDYTRESLEELLRVTLIPDDRKSWWEKSFLLPLFRSRKSDDDAKKTEQQKKGGA